MRIVSACLPIVLLASLVLAAEPTTRVSLEILTRPGLNITAAQQWSRTLGDLGFAGVQIRPAVTGEEMQITQIGTTAAPHFKVTGILANDNTLNLPGGKFSAGDTPKLRKWLDTIRDQGPEGVTQAGGPFGLTKKQLAEATKELTRPVDFSTRDLPAPEAVERIGKRLKSPLEVDPAAARELATLNVLDELQTVSSGTALAALVRPAGLALAPEHTSGGAWKYRIAKAQAGRESWPIGRTPPGRPAQLAPAMFETLNVEIKDIPVSEALTAIQERLAMPFLYDYNAMALHAVDPSQVTAAVPSKRLSYSQILNTVLNQTKLKYELRADDAEELFLWITTVKRSE